MSTYREVSRENWNPNGPTTVNDIKAGCLQRIADATEKMAQSYATLVAERDRYERWWKTEKDAKETSYRVNSNLRGQITKLNNRITGLSKALEEARATIKDRS